MAGRGGIAGTLCAAAAGAAALGAFSSACNSLSGIGDFTVGDASAVTPDVEATGDGASEAQVDAPAPGQDAPGIEGAAPDGSMPSDAHGEASEPLEAGDGPVDGPENGGDGGDGGRLDGGPGEAGDGGGARDAGDAGSDAAADTGGGTGPCDGGTAPVVHSNGLGQTFSDCAPLGTINVTQALEACDAYTSDAGACSIYLTCSAGSELCAGNATNCACWRYDGNTAGHVATMSGGCNCIGSSSPTWN
jgi:hypothetical protein